MQISLHQKLGSDQTIYMILSSQSLRKAPKCKGRSRMTMRIRPLKMRPLLSNQCSKVTRFAKNWMKSKLSTGTCLSRSRRKTRRAQASRTRTRRESGGKTRILLQCARPLTALLMSRPNGRGRLDKSPMPRQLMPTPRKPRLLTGRKGKTPTCQPWVVVLPLTSYLVAPLIRGQKCDRTPTSVQSQMCLPQRKVQETRRKDCTSDRTLIMMPSPAFQKALPNLRPGGKIHIKMQWGVFLKVHQDHPPRDKILTRMLLIASQKVHQSLRLNDRTPTKMLWQAFQRVPPHPQRSKQQIAREKRRRQAKLARGNDLISSPLEKLSATSLPPAYPLR